MTSLRSSTLVVLCSAVTAGGAVVAWVSYQRQRDNNATNKEKDNASSTSKTKLYAPPTRKERVTAAVASFVLRAYGLERKTTVWLPPADDVDTESSSSPSPPVVVLWILFAGVNLHPDDYTAMVRTVQRRAKTTRGGVTLVAAMMEPVLPAAVAWALAKLYSPTGTSVPQGMAGWLERRAVEQMSLLQKNNNSQPPASKATKRFDVIFVGGHSMGGHVALQAAYPSKYQGLLLLGCTADLVATMQQLMARMPHQHVKQLQQSPPETWIASYPRPILTILGGRDGLIRYYRMAYEDKVLQQDLHRVVQGHHHDNDQTLRDKPLVVLPDMNHMQFAHNRLPPASQQTGRHDFSSTLSLQQAHEQLAAVVVEFMNAHKNGSGSGSAVYDERLRSRTRDTRDIYLDPYSHLVDRVAMSRFVDRLVQSQFQRRLLAPLDQQGTEHQGSDDSGQSLVSITSRWHVHPDHFLYSQPALMVDEEHGQRRPHLCIEVIEQPPLLFSKQHPQLSPTLAIKAKTPEYVASQGRNKNDNNEATVAAKKQSPPPSLQDWNRHTFDYVLYHVVTPAQRNYYFTHGRPLEFGPDVAMGYGPSFVDGPLIVETKTASGNNQKHDFVYVLSSPYLVTPVDFPPPFGGAWYIKPLTPAQAYEYIVYDAFH